MQRGHDAVADFIGTDVSSDSYERLLDETEAQMPSEEFKKFWERYILGGLNYDFSKNSGCSG